jgi:hypothetical protein
MFEQIVDREMNAWNDIDATTLWASLLRKPWDAIGENEGAMFAHGRAHICNVNSRTRNIETINLSYDIRNLR